MPISSSQLFDCTQLVWTKFKHCCASICGPESRQCAQDPSLLGSGFEQCAGAGLALAQTGLAKAGDRASKGAQHQEKSAPGCARFESSPEGFLDCCCACCRRCGERSRHAATACQASLRLLLGAHASDEVFCRCLVLLGQKRPADLRGISVAILREGSHSSHPHSAAVFAGACRTSLARLWRCCCSTLQRDKQTPSENQVISCHCSALWTLEAA